MENDKTKCPLGGDTANKCADCEYGRDYKCEDGECVPRKREPRMSPYERTRAAVYATGNRWAIENFNATHN
jgi:hypothetical protein